MRFEKAKEITDNQKDAVFVAIRKALKSGLTTTREGYADGTIKRAKTVHSDAAHADAGIAHPMPRTHIHIHIHYLQTHRSKS